MSITMKLKSPLFAEWSPQHARLTVPNLKTGAPFALKIDGRPGLFQYTGRDTPAGAEVIVLLGFEPGQTRTLEFAKAPAAETDLSEVEIPSAGGAAFGVPPREIGLPALPCTGGMLPGPFESFAGFPLKSAIRCNFPLLSRKLVQTNAGPLFTDYRLAYSFAENHHYSLALRCYRLECAVEVCEEFSLGLDAELQLVLNPGGAFDSIISHNGPEFEGEPQPVIAPLGAEHPRDVLCRMQMPVLSEYFVPNNRGWFALFDSRNEARGMAGLMGLYGGRWQRPVENMMKVLDRGGSAELHASLFSGTRHWLLYAGPVEKSFTPQRRFIFHRLHANFNALRLDEHLDLDGHTEWDAHCWSKPGFFGADYRERAKRNAEALAPLRKAMEGKASPALLALIEPSQENHQALLDDILHRFEKWVRDFQGFREGKHDYAKNVIGFSRRLRGIMLAYELLRKDHFLSDEHVRCLHAYFAFAARRIMDEGRWPHSRTWKHRDHPESTRDFYGYPGEHKPDRLVWTNCLPNFQSDPMCALLHLGALIPEHPDAGSWVRFAQDDIERQLNAYCAPGGAWEESINYALYTFSYLIITFRILKNRLGIDYFQDRRMRAYAGWLVRFFGPLDKRWGAYTFPGIGNAVLPQNQGDYLLAYAGELPEGDQLRDDLIAAYQKMEPAINLGEHSPMMMAAMAPIPERQYELRPLHSEHMQELGIAFRHEHPSPHESYLFEKAGLWKDHYEYDETAINWYAKGTPLVMEYGTYTGDAGAGAAHNLVEIPDLDPLRRGFVMQTMFTPLVDYSHVEVPVTLKLSHGRMRSFAEVDGPPEKPAFFYIGDENPVGPRMWKNRLLLFVKPDYVVMFDRVFGAVPHRYNLHATADALERQGSCIAASGRFDLDLLCFVQHPQEFGFESGEFVPGPQRYGQGAANPHRQVFFRLYNLTDGIYRTLLFAQERSRGVRIERLGAAGIRVVTHEYTDCIFIGDEITHEAVDGVRFSGRVGWMRREASGKVMACMPDGDSISAFGRRIEGRGPLTWNMAGDGAIEIEGVPRAVKVG